MGFIEYTVTLYDTCKQLHLLCYPLFSNTCQTTMQLPIITVLPLLLSLAAAAATKPLNKCCILRGLRARFKTEADFRTATAKSCPSRAPYNGQFILAGGAADEWTGFCVILGGDDEGTLHNDIMFSCHPHWDPAWGWRGKCSDS